MTFDCCPCCGPEEDGCPFNHRRDNHIDECPVCEVPCPIHGNEPHEPAVGMLVVPPCVKGRAYR